MPPHRRLLVLGLNALLDTGRIALAPTEGEAEAGHLFTDIAGRPSVVIWQDAGFGEIRISVWWDYHHTRHPQADAQGNERETFCLTHPLARREFYPRFVGATASGWRIKRHQEPVQGRH